MTTLAAIRAQFVLCKSWEERYRLLIRLGRLLPKPDEEELAALPEIHGCESRLWFDFQLEPRRVRAYSDARLMQGILQIICVVLNEKSAQELKGFSFQALFESLKITQSLTDTRLNGLKQIQALIGQALN